MRHRSGRLRVLLATPPAAAVRDQADQSVSMTFPPISLTPIRSRYRWISHRAAVVDQPATGDATADPVRSPTPIVADDGGTVVDQPVVAEESGDPVITGDPVIEPVLTVDDDRIYPYTDGSGAVRPADPDWAVGPASSRPAPTHGFLVSSGGRRVGSTRPELCVDRGV